MKQYIDLTNDNQLTAEKLNHLLANMQVYYQNMRGFHWNIKGEKFFELHVKFEEFYTLAANRIDEIAERILTLGGVPLHTFEDYRSESEIATHKDQSDAAAIMDAIWGMHNTLLANMREVINAASERDDEGTQDMLTPMINEIEKSNWMVGAYLKK